MLKPTLAKVLVAFWAIAVVASMVALWRYKTTPAPSASAAPATWPADVPLTRNPGRATVVMLAHPKCPCTKASMTELAVLMARVGRSTDAYVLFVIPNGAEAGFEKGATWTQAASIPGVQVVSDPKGAIAAKFGATVSGHTVAYDAAGQLAYSGGITASRGHAGENEGRWQIVARIENAQGTPPGHAPTYGCGLYDVEAKGDVR
jgi:hypothetical protein